MKNLVKLGSLTSIRTGKLDANASSENGKYPFFTCSKEPLRIDSYSYNCECVLVAGNGDLNVKYYDGKFYAYQRTYIIESTDKSKLLVKYLYFFLDIYVEVLRTQSIGGVIKYIKLGNLTDAMIPLPSIEEQEVIVDHLEKCNDLLNRRIRQLAILDQLVKSRFIELFGDPVSATKEEKVELLELCEKITDGEHGSVARISEGHPFLNAKHILKNGNIDWDTITFIGELEHQRIYKRCNPEPGDILLTTTGTIGNVAIMPECEEVSMDRGITLLKINHEKVTSEFVAELLRQDSVQIEMRANVHASAIGHLFMNKVKKLPAILPAMDRQMEFTKFVKQTDKSKYYSQKFLTLCRLAVNIYEQEWMKCQTLNF